MKKLFQTIFLLAVVYILGSCSSDSVENNNVSNSELVTEYTYNTSELKVLELINEYRVSIGLNSLKTVNHISFKSEEHDNYMIANKVVNHNDFIARSENIIDVLGAKKVGENIAYNYQTAEGVLKAWLDSPSHKQNIEGDYTHFGIAVKIDAETGKKYYTNIFAKI
ncbi:CAP domain-containing protein [Flavobacterium hibisci]|uniref:CAP domain-containing protein n=1 Tax=Flavobacterium hibisci TaxID=1914462 RepID=UPI001CBD46BB|nr:CAP domain-containing protein [Flavobacterium hibisci]MBZ4042158.1 CAP domain-containing protein [Flavobacterium hibisci]